MRWVMRVMAVGGLTIAGFLLLTHIAAHWAAARQTVPLCPGLSWLDCESVLNSRWARVFGVPVALPAVGAYLALALALFGIGPRRSDKALRRLWWGVITLVTAAVVAAGWFIYLQLAVLDRLCSWCMIEHAIALILGGLVSLHVGVIAPSLGRAMPTAVLAGALGAAALIGGQWFVVPRYTQPIEWQTQAQRYVEPGEEGDLVRLFEGQVTLNRRAHPVIGLTPADRLVIEVIDYTCVRCGTVNGLLRDARPYLPPDVAVLIVYAPQSSDCNEQILEDRPRYAHACRLAKLAVAVWLADPSHYEPFHHWLFEHQDGLTPAAARREAVRRIGETALDEALADSRVDQMIQRDLQLAGRLEIGWMPGLIVGDRRFSAIPEEPGELARAIRRALRPATPD